MVDALVVGSTSQGRPPVEDRVSPFEILVKEALRGADRRNGDDDPELVGGHELALDAALRPLDGTGSDT